MRSQNANPPRTPIGAVLLLSAPILFVGAQFLVGSTWSIPYSWSHNNISDLGNVTCGPVGEPERHVCSPHHGWMNLAFLVTGLLLAAGIGAGWRRLGAEGIAVTTKVSVLLCSVGYALAGVYPADVDENLHVLGALLILGPGNIALLATGITSRASPVLFLRISAFVLGATGALGTWMHLSRDYGGLGMGGTERIAAFALLIWLGLVGVRLLASEPAGLRPPSSRQQRHGPERPEALQDQPDDQ